MLEIYTYIFNLGFTELKICNLNLKFTGNFKNRYQPINSLITATSYQRLIEVDMLGLP